MESSRAPVTESVNTVLTRMPQASATSPCESASAAKTTSEATEPPPKPSAAAP